MSNNLFKVPFGFYNENIGFVSKKSQIEDLLDSINSDAEANAQMDAEQTEKIVSNTEAINKEVERSSSLDEKFESDLENEIAERKRMGGILNSKIADLDSNLRTLVEETDKGFDVVADELRKKDENLDAKDAELTSLISNLEEVLNEEVSNRKNADDILSEAIKLNSSDIDEMSNNINSLNDGINEEKTNRENADNVLTEKINTLVSSVKEVYDYAKSIDEELSNIDIPETEGCVKWVDLGNDRKSIVLENNDLILGKSTEGDAQNIAMVSKWNVVDLGSSKLPINLNTPSGVRPTVQEAGQSGEEANKIAYLSDIDSNVNAIKEEETRAKAAEKTLQDNLDSSVLTLNSSISNVNSTLATLASTDTALNGRVDVIDSSLKQLKANGIELKQVSPLQYILYVDGMAKGAIDIPKDNFLTNVYLTNDNKLHFVFNVSEQQTDIEVDIAKYIDIYTAGKGLTLDSNKFSILVNEGSESYLTVSDNGLSLNGIYKDITTVVSVETNRATSVEDALGQQIDIENERAKNAESTLSQQIVNETNRATSVENGLASRIVKVENFEPTILNNTNNIQSLSNRLSIEESRALYVEEQLKNDIANEVSKRSSKDEELSSILSTEIANREAKDTELEQSLQTLSEEISSIEANDAEMEQSINMLSEAVGKVNENYKAAVAAETERAISVENKKVDLVDLGNNRKSIVLENNDLILGKSTEGDVQNIAMVSKWNVVDLGSSKLPINLNTPSGVRPTVQEAGQSGEEANKIAYLSDIDEVKNNIPSLEGYATEEWVEGKGYLTEHQDLSNLATKEEIPTIPTKVSEFENDANYLTEHQDLSEYALKSDIPSLEGYATEEWVEGKGYLTEHQDLSNLATKEEIANMVEYSQADDKKVILLDNGDLIMGKVNPDSEIQPEPSASALTLLQLNKWNIIDLGSPKSILNINVHEGYRPTVQESNQSGEEAHKIAYLEDIEALKVLIDELQAKIKNLEGRVYDSNQLIDMISNLKEGDNVDLTLYNNVVVNEDLKMTIPANATVNLNLNGKTITGTYTGILFRVYGTLNIDGNGTVNGRAYVASAYDGGTVTVLNGTYNNKITSFQANGGTIIVEGGYFNSYTEEYGSKYTLNHIDAKKNDGLISVKGGTFVNYNPSESYSENPPMDFLAEGYGVIETVEGEDHIYRVARTNKVNTNDELVTLLNSLNDDKETLIELDEDITIDETFDKIVINGNVTIDLNGKTLTQTTMEDILFRVNGTLNIYGGTVISNGYAASANKGGVVNVLGGTYNCNTTCFQSNGGILNISNGYFSSCNDTYGCKYTINFIDSMKNVGEINVSGGSFVGYDPSASESENPAENFVVDGYKSVETIEDDLVVFTVIKQ